MSETAPWDLPLPPEMLAPPSAPLSEAQLAILWRLFQGIDTHWRLNFDVNLLRSRWLDMLDARSAGQPDYRGEFVNAAEVYAALVEKLGEAGAIAKLYAQTSVTASEEATTRLRHAKLYVANDFIRCFIACGGFRGFVKEARNYTGFMGGSRFREWAPVRIGKRT